MSENPYQSPREIDPAQTLPPELTPAKKLALANVMLMTAPAIGIAAGTSCSAAGSVLFNSVRGAEPYGLILPSLGLGMLVGSVVLAISLQVVWTKLRRRWISDREAGAEWAKLLPSYVVVAGLRCLIMALPAAFVGYTIAGIVAVMFALLPRSIPEWLDFALIFAGCGSVFFAILAAVATFSLDRSLRKAVERTRRRAT